MTRIRPQKTVFYICGPTASGKTDFSVELARRLPNAVFINADSMQLFKGLEPMAAHPTPAQQAQMDARLFGVLDLGRDVSRAEWLAMARTEIEKAFAAGKQPILIGGSRSLAAALMKAAHDLDVPVDLENARTLPEGTAASGAFPYALRTILVMPPLDEKSNAAIEQRIKKSQGPALHAVMEALKKGHPLSKPGFLVFGAREYAAYLYGLTSLDEAEKEVLKKTVNYMHEQRTIYHQLELALRRNDPASILHLSTTDNTQRAIKAAAYIRHHAAPAPAHKKSPSCKP